MHSKHEKHNLDWAEKLARRGVVVKLRPGYHRRPDPVLPPGQRPKREKPRGVRHRKGARLDAELLVCSSCCKPCGRDGAYTEQDVTVYPKFVAHAADALEVQCRPCAEKSGRKARIEKHAP